MRLRPVRAVMVRGLIVLMYQGRGLAALTGGSYCRCCCWSSHSFGAAFGQCLYYFSLSLLSV